MFIENYRRLVLRRGDLHHVACRIRSSSSGDVHRCLKNYYRVTRCERSGQNHRIAGCDPYHSKHTPLFCVVVVLSFFFVANVYPLILYT